METVQEHIRRVGDVALEYRRPFGLQHHSIGRGDGPYHVVLPLPPSTNHLFATVGRRRVLSEEYTAWREAAFVYANTQGFPTTSFPKGTLWYVDMHVLLHGRRRDVDNTIKPVLDWLTKRLGLDDRYVQQLHVWRWPVYMEGGEGVEALVKVNP